MFRMSAPEIGKPTCWAADFLMPGGSVMVDIDDRNGRCRVDFKTVLDDGSDLVSRSINVCRSEDTAVSLR